MFLYNNISVWGDENMVLVYLMYRPSAWGMIRDNYEVAVGEEEKIALLQAGFQYRKILRELAE